MILRAKGIEKAFGSKHVLRGCDIAVAAGQCIGLVGLNGCGKSTLLSIMGGEQNPDHGTVELYGQLGLLTQRPTLLFDTVGQAADAAVQWHADLLTAYDDALSREDIDETSRLQDQLDLHGWDLSHRVAAVLDKLKAPAREAKIAHLSGGQFRRLALARALLSAADALLLDEPTNHLDTDSVEWLESFLTKYRGAVVLVTHDRYLLETVANRIIEVEDGETVAYQGSYTDYLIERAERRMRLEKTEDRRLDLIQREAQWASRSPAARTTKQSARLKRLDVLRDKRPLKKEETFSLDLKGGIRLQGAVLELQNLHKSFGDLTILSGLTESVSPRERIGIVGPNGCGKSTLLKMIIGSESCDKGQVIRAGRLKLAVLDQQRSGLDPTDTVFDAAGNGNDHIFIGDHPVHVASFLRRFLFDRETLDKKVSTLSGGEQARLLLAKLMLKGAGMILLDEPTNDLDLQTLRVLEEALLSYDGAAIIVTHDRAFLDRVCTSVLAFEGDGQVTRYASRIQYQRVHKIRLAEKATAAKIAREKDKAKREAARAERSKPAPKKKKKRLSFKESRELETLPDLIEVAEERVEELNTLMADPALYKSRADEVPVLGAELSALPKQIEEMYARWEELSERA